MYNVKFTNTDNGKSTSCQLMNSKDFENFGETIRYFEKLPYIKVEVKEFKDFKELEEGEY